MYLNQLFSFLSSIAELSEEIEQAGTVSKEHRKMLTRIIKMYRDYANLPHAFKDERKKIATLQNADEVLDFAQDLYNKIGKTVVRLYVVLCVPDIDTWEMLKPLASAFESDSDCICGVAVTDELAPYCSDGSIEFLPFSKWLESGDCADIVIIPCAYPADIWSMLSSRALAAVYLPIFEEQDAESAQNAFNAAWRAIIGAGSDINTMPNAIYIEDAKPLPCRPAGLPISRYQLLSQSLGNKKWLAWEVSSYNDILSDNSLSSTDFLTYIIQNTDFNIIWLQPSDISCSKPALPYLQDIVVTVKQSGRALLINADELSFVLQNSCGICSDNETTLTLFSKMGYPTLSARHESETEIKLRRFIKAADELPNRALLRENYAKNVKVAIIREFEKDFLSK